jgi:hypothetical protein
MPAANASGEIFSLSGDARYEGIVNGRVGAGGSLSVSLDAEACHGLSVEASAQALAQVNAALSLILASRGSAFATAAAGLNAKIQFKPDAFDRFGIILDAAAYAEASAGFRLAMGLDLSLIWRFAKDNLPGPAQEIFFAFLQEIVVEAGVWGRASAAVMAQAHVDITLSLGEDDDAGFTIEGGAAAGWGAGTGWDFYGAATFNDPRRFFRTCSRVIGREAAARARAQLPGEFQFGGDIIELLLPVALNCAYEIGQTAALQTLGPPDIMVGKLTGALGVSLRDFTLERMIQSACDWIEDIIYECAVCAVDQQLTETQRLIFEDAVSSLTTYVVDNENRNIDLEDLPELSLRVLAVVSAAFPDDQDKHGDAIALIWTGIACGKALGDMAPVVSGQLSIIGIVNGELSADFPALAQAPELVIARYEKVLQRQIDTINYADAIDYLVVIGIEPLIDHYNPAASAFLNDLSQRLALTIGDLCEIGLSFALGRDEAPVIFYEKIRGFIEAWLDDTLRTEVLPRVRVAAGEAESPYVTEVAEPSLAALSSFLMKKLDAVVLGIAAGEENAFVDKLSAGCSAIIYRIVARNVLFFEHALFDHIVLNLRRAFENVADAVSTDREHSLVRFMETVLRSQMPFLPPLDDRGLEAVQLLAEDLARIGAEAFGENVWSESRRELYGELKRDAILGYEGENPFATEAIAEDLARALILCDMVPNKDAMIGLAQFLGEQLLTEMRIVGPKGIAALERFALAATRSTAEDLDRTARGLIAKLASFVDRALRKLNALIRRLGEVREALEAAISEGADALESISNELRRDDLKAAVKASLYQMGSEEAERIVRAHYLDPNRNDPGEDQAAAAAVGAFYIGFVVAEPIFDLAVNAIALSAEEVSEVIRTSADAADALEAFVSRIIAIARAAVDAGVGAFGLQLPSELSATNVADAIVNALPADLILGLLDRWFDAKIDQQNARQQVSALTTNRDQAQNEYIESKERLRKAGSTGQIRVSANEPARIPDDLDDLWRYGFQVPVNVRIDSVTSSFFARGKARRVRVALNYQVIDYAPQHWSEIETDKFEWKSSFTAGKHSLVQGLNVLEITITAGDQSMVRHTVPFIVDLNSREAAGVRRTNQGKLETHS